MVVLALVAITAQACSGSESKAALVKDSSLLPAVAAKTRVDELVKHDQFSGALLVTRVTLPRV